MANTYKALSTVTVGAGGASTISFTNIPQTYTDLVLMTSLRSTDTSGNWGAAGIRFNGDTNTNYNAIEVYGTGSAAGSGTSSSATSLNGARPNSNGTTANTFSSGSLYIPNYTSSNQKSTSEDSVTENNATAALSPLVAGRWSGTSPITSMVITPSGGFTWMQYSTATLYGVFNADVSTAPATPTIGTATAGNTTASITFTGVSNAASYTMTSTPGSITGTGATSPITVSGLTNNTAYTFKVKSNNPFGSSAESAASNSVTPSAATFESIATVSVGAGGASSISFSSIPSTYTHLQLRYIAQKTSNGSMYIRFNGDTGNSYTNHTLQGNGTAMSSNSNTGANGTDIGASDSSGNFAASVIDILDYTDTNKNTTIRQLFGRDYNGSGVVWLKSGLWLNTAAITSITLVPDSTNVVQNSHFALYGIKSV